ncbi:plasmid replication initiator protein [Streptomyces lunaelactis]|uniref:replication initiator n=1 Tax=Streptomyces lunaelactis TaxID=1535768 RepID=UPI0015851764|nr:replication initiator [Streptomyces lunaelactis]NUK48842.1 plasmid replication initiator protein [Streptomyces lunaelactis]NUK64996.1 plasmid replication initiator protein [Streptomyces lunaelactis]
MLDRAARLRQLTEVDRDVIRLAQDSQFARWLEQITATGGCAHPIHLTGATTVRDTYSGEILHHYDTSAEPGERLLVRCRNRRATVCASCSRLHAGDTFHLVRAGLVGGKAVPADVRQHPRLFLTLTAPGFGPVHRVTAETERCRPRRDSARCEHGRATRCPGRHTAADPLVGQPLCCDCYDYAGHVLWHAHTGELWARFARGVRRVLASAAGLVQTRFPEHARLSFAKVAEYQRRAAVHVHAVVRLDGPSGPHGSPPPWATADALTTAVRAAARAVTVHSPYSPATGERVLRWGIQLDTRPLRAFDDAKGPADDAVAAYVAKYVTKGAADTAAGTDYRLTSAGDIETAVVSPHVRSLMRACWRLGGLREFEPLRLRAWAHTLGFRGHILTKSRAYSTTYASLRAERAEHERTAAGIDVPHDPGRATDAHWRYIGSGHTPGAALIAAGIAEDLARNREIASAEQESERRRRRGN